LQEKVGTEEVLGEGLVEEEEVLASSKLVCSEWLNLYALLKRPPLKFATCCCFLFIGVGAGLAVAMM
jgi:hypothetical protein